jgi:hypothetical protein
MAVFDCAPANVHKQRTHPGKTSPVRAASSLEPSDALVTLVFSPCRFLWHIHPPPRYTCIRGRDLCACPQPHPPCGPRKVFENQGTRLTSRALARSSAKTELASTRIPETTRETNPRWLYNPIVSATLPISPLIVLLCKPSASKSFISATLHKAGGRVVLSDIDGHPACVGHPASDSVTPRNKSLTILNQ